MSKSNQVRIAVAGGGLLGRLLAWRLAGRGHSVSLYEAGKLETPTGACWTAAGMISPLSELVHSQPLIYQQGMRSLKLWPDWVSILETQTGLAVGFRRAGSLLVAHPQDRSELLQFRQELQAKLRQNVREENAAKSDEYPTVPPLLDTQELQQLEPALYRFEQGLFLAGEADIDNRRLLPALHKVLQIQQVSLHEQVSVDCSAGKIHRGKSVESFDCVIDCRGLGARQQVRELRGVRGEVLVVETNEVELKRPVRLLHPRYQLYAVPRANGQTVIGATEIESDDMSAISLRSSMELCSALYSLHPAFSEARIVESRVNCRPAMMDNLPLIHSEPGLLRVNGLYRHGYLLAPAVIEQVESLIEQQIFEVT